MASREECRITDRASAATDSADRQRYATEVPPPECYRTRERPAVCCQLQALVRQRAKLRQIQRAVSATGRQAPYRSHLPKRA
jgi:hypothetical protein